MFIAQAYKGNNEWWRVFVTTLLTTGIFVLNFVVLLFLSDDQVKDMYDSMKGIPNNLALAINLLPFAFLLGMLFLLVYFLHQRSIMSLTTARSKIDFGRIAFAFALVVLLSASTFAVSFYMDSSNMEWNFKLWPFIIMIVISLILFPLQIGFEEYLFRGYLMQQIGIAVQNRWFPLVVTSVFFGLFHSANPEVLEMGYGVMAFYIGTGFLLGIITLMDDSLELAFGFHLGNNLMACILVTSEYSALQTEALYRYNEVQDSAIVLNEMLVSMAITYPLILLILCKKYKWSGWKEKLTGKIKNYGNAIPKEANGQSDL